MYEFYEFYFDRMICNHVTMRGKLIFRLRAAATTVCFFFNHHDLGRCTCTLTGAADPCWYACAVLVLWCVLLGWFPKEFAGDVCSSLRHSGSDGSPRSGRCECWPDNALVRMLVLGSDGSPRSGRCECWPDNALVRMPVLGSDGSPRSGRCECWPDNALVRMPVLGFYLITTVHVETLPVVTNLIVW